MNAQDDGDTGWGAEGGASSAVTPAEPEDERSALADGAVELWSFPLVRTEGDWDTLTADERARAERLIIAEKRVQMIAGRAAIRRVLAGHVGVAPERIELCTGPDGKPALSDPGGPSFNLSHSGGRALLAVAREGALGVDLERARPGRSFDAIASRWFSPSEYAAFADTAADESAAVEIFYRLWTAKEAYLKAWGTGLRFASDRFTVHLEVARARLIATEMPGDDVARWSIVSVPAPAGYVAALCWDRPPLAVVSRSVEALWMSAPAPLIAKTGGRA